MSIMSDSQDSVEPNLPTQDELYTPETLKKLSHGFLYLYEPHLRKTQRQLKELTTKQEALIETLSNENNKLILSQNNSDLLVTIDKIKCYKDKLLNIRKEMMACHDRTTKLKKRAIKLQQLKEAELQKRNLQIKKEQDLIAKRDSPSSP